MQHARLLHCTHNMIHVAEIPCRPHTSFSAAMSYAIAAQSGCPPGMLRRGRAARGRAPDAVVVHGRDVRQEDLPRHLNQLRLVALEPAMCAAPSSGSPGTPTFPAPMPQHAHLYSMHVFTSTWHGHGPSSVNEREACLGRVRGWARARGAGAPIVLVAGDHVDDDAVRIAHRPLRATLQCGLPAARQSCSQLCYSHARPLTGREQPSMRRWIGSGGRTKLRLLSERNCNGHMHAAPSFGSCTCLAPQVLAISALCRETCQSPDRWL